MIVKIQDSPIQYKRYRVWMDDGKHYDFGLFDGDTYIDHHDKQKRLNYLKRHLANETEKKLIENLVPSPALFSALLLWGKHTSLRANIDELNKMWKKKHQK